MHHKNLNNLNIIINIIQNLHIPLILHNLHIFHSHYILHHLHNHYHILHILLNH